MMCQLDLIHFCSHRLSLEAKPEEPGEDEKMKPVLEALAELKEDISPEEAIAALK